LLQKAQFFLFNDLDAWVELLDDLLVLSSADDVLLHEAEELLNLLFALEWLVEEVDGKFSLVSIFSRLWNLLNLKK
jgi:hypothetical protein